MPEFRIIPAPQEPERHRRRYSPCFFWLQTVLLPLSLAISDGFYLITQGHLFPPALFLTFVPDFVLLVRFSVPALCSSVSRARVSDRLSSFFIKRWPGLFH